jgi:hypothetical protein
MSENEEPDWLAELAKGGEALRRQVEPIVQAAEQFVRDARQAKASDGGPALPFAQRVALAVDAGMRELLPTPVHAVVHPGTLSVSVSFPLPTITVSGSLPLPPARMVAFGEVASASDSLSVERRGPGRSVAEFSDGQIVFLVLVWLYAVWLPWFGSRLPPELHGMLSDSLATFAIALSITWRIRDKHK